ncbi:MAG: hypothetical protein JXR25_16820 [Pontiellaceae bacterium]|nr:hypothetical protein [Pontiellaceae bacterium]MBN2786486.1 hypothetical protein [Pontiellaceae bacterium]
MSDAVSNSIMEILPDLNRGDLPHDASMELDHVIQAVKETGKDGSLTIKLKVSAVKSGSIEINEVDIHAAVEAKIPKPTKRPTGFFIGRGGKLQRDNPNQLQFEATKGAE